MSYGQYGGNPYGNDGYGESNPYGTTSAGYGASNPYGGQVRITSPTSRQATRR